MESHRRSASCFWGVTLASRVDLVHSFWLRGGVHCSMIHPPTPLLRAMTVLHRGGDRPVPLGGPQSGCSPFLRLSNGSPRTWSETTVLLFPCSGGRLGLARHSFCWSRVESIPQSDSVYRRMFRRHRDLQASLPFRRGLLPLTWCLHTPKARKQKLPGLPQARTQMPRLSFLVVTGSDRPAQSQSGRGPERERSVVGAISEDQAPAGWGAQGGFPEPQV